MIPARAMPSRHGVLRPGSSKAFPQHQSPLQPVPEPFNGPGTWWVGGCPSPPSPLRGLGPAESGPGGLIPREGSLRSQVGRFRYPAGRVLTSPRWLGLPSLPPARACQGSPSRRGRARARRKIAGRSSLSQQVPPMCRRQIDAGLRSRRVLPASCLQSRRVLPASCLRSSRVLPACVADTCFLLA